MGTSAEWEIISAALTAALPQLPPTSLPVHWEAIYRFAQENRLGPLPYRSLGRSAGIPADFRQKLTADYHGAQAYGLIR